ncbi:hypothetical protein [Klugiella xanthotipulae]|uniref:hypothetical protein n=1 Tax=Klugiella xanthotipulae TaxID=244735 RepID=UPI001FEB5A1E|nr:hypothetical protein [Klugiella xanthotipulae]
MASATGSSAKLAVMPTVETLRRDVTIRYRLTPWWLRIVIIFIASRIVSTSLLLYFASRQVPVMGWVSGAPSLAEYSTLWDGQWYWRIALYGYPSELPVDGAGLVTENAWAFMPVFPFLVRGLSLITTVPWPILAPTVSVIFGLATALLFYRLLRSYLDCSQALFAVALYCFAPISPLLQVSYAESMGAFLLTLMLWLLVRRRYALMVPTIMLMALTRPMGLACALTLGLWWVFRWLRRAVDPFPVREMLAGAGLAVLSGVMGFLWPGIAWIVTGSLTAYTDTELAWRRPYIGEGHLVPFTAWFQGANWWFGVPLGSILLIVLLALVVAAFWLPQMRRLGLELRLWTVSYGLYLLAVFFPQSSTFRLLMPFFPVLGAIAQPRSRLYRAALILLCLVGQWAWLSIAWWIDDADWTPP